MTLTKVSYVCRYCHGHFTEETALPVVDLIDTRRNSSYRVHACHPKEAPHKRGVCDLVAVEEVEA